ncbi:DeoR family transcriptional regulator [Neorhizobium sp. R1-B]|jgi:DeoR/GlpR family transcriptional regulator of sugar metabolism|uniref:DeoR/GlpR family DNA-binding transcription regulator n=1 Tax=Neorhizobium sp. R1-B TaxID=2485162 RepID=UPI001066BCDB|nr:DeoR/GlpR family DNA-binding transcription regulator [Neorhizobium sp. R1-B]TDX79654.1 DeoR family transcriptional regulator [Neorhizobium sp. R1-B]
MLTEERHDRIRGELARKGKVLAAQLAVDFGVSEDTVRRDLREMARMGLCRRVYGGALSPAPDLGTIQTRSAILSEAKHRLGAAIGELLKSGQTIFIDAGSTNITIAGAIPVDTQLTVITNAPSIALALENHEKCRTILLGGIFSPSKGACLGGQVLREAQQIFADIFILGACGIDAEIGLTALDAEEAELKRCMIEQSNQLWVPVTVDKIGTVAPYKIADASAIGKLFAVSDDEGALTLPFSEKGIVVHEVRSNYFARKLDGG